MNSDNIVGRAFRCGDGLVRWFVHRSKRGYLHTLWLRESDNVWHLGARMLPGDVELGDEYPVPQPGETYRLCGAMGCVEDRTA